MRNRLMFVDDNAELLKGLSRMLRPMREEWDMVFLPGGSDALKEMHSTCFDVVVSDMRMPGMDGAELLREVKNFCPRSVRIMLSGQADLGAIIRGLDPIHQYLSKPCSAETLVQIINQTRSLRDLLKPTKLQAAVANTYSIPALPAAVESVRRELEQTNPNLELIAATVSRDIGMSAKVLQLVNSAFFGPRRQLVNPHEAARILGIQVLRPLVFDGKVFDSSHLQERHPAFLDSLVLRGRRVATAAAAIARDAGADDACVQASYLAGLLHGVGKLVLRNEFDDEYFTAMMQALQHRQSTEEAETTAFGATHHDIGAYLLGLWGIPASVFSAVSSAHRPQLSSQDKFSPMTALHVAGALLFESKDSTIGSWELDEWYLDMLGLLPKLKAWAQVCNEVTLLPHEVVYE